LFGASSFQLLRVFRTAVPTSVKWSNELKIFYTRIIYFEIKEYYLRIGESLSIYLVHIVLVIVVSILLLLIESVIKNNVNQ